MFKQFKSQIGISGVFKGVAEGRYVGLANPIDVIGEDEMVLDELMPSDALLVSCTSIISWSRSLSRSPAAPAVYGAKFLIDILGPGSLEGSIIYGIFNEHFKLIGEVEQRFNALIKEDSEGYVDIGETVIEGSCRGEGCKGGYCQILSGLCCIP
jgi:hypothetical protein